MTDVFSHELDLDREVYKKPIDPAIIKKDPSGNKYVTAYNVVKIADLAFNEKWSLEITKTWSEKIADYDIVFFAAVTVTVPGLGSRSAVGGVSFRDILKKAGKGKPLSELIPADVQATRSSDLYKTAVTDGMKKAMSLFQICGDVYVSEKDKMELGDRQPFGPPAPKVPMPAPKRLGELSKENKIEAKSLMDQHGLKKMSELGDALDAADIKVLDDSTLADFKTYLASGKDASPKEEKKDIPV